jgi:hypothetical protein
MAGDLPDRGLDAEADEALETARALPSGQAKMEALKKADCCAMRPMQAGFPSRSVAGRGNRPP